ncbi:hypothetical protein NAPIS_ORF00946 [Vairimorpha apis BRL 01]|uniref:Uncharacterized protein n=1 Tax=Vairimorpha apis BRL 01 TaxID=1037528 RepID=T0LB28_9MICR|nr:hypothetical protein NAPIS_ORF00946 [Vairimorpha apis BRL 01]
MHHHVKSLNEQEYHPIPHYQQNSPTSSQPFPMMPPQQPQALPQGQYGFLQTHPPLQPSIQQQLPPQQMPQPIYHQHQPHQQVPPTISQFSQPPQIVKPPQFQPIYQIPDQKSNQPQMQSPPVLFSYPPQLYNIPQPTQSVSYTPQKPPSTDQNDTDSGENDPYLHNNNNNIHQNEVPYQQVQQPVETLPYYNNVATPQTAPVIVNVDSNHNEKSNKPNSKAKKLKEKFNKTFGFND